MRKVIKILGKVLAWIIIAIVALPLLAALLLNIGAVQNFAVRQGTRWLSQKLETTVSIDRIRLRGFSKLYAEGIYVEDYNGDTLLYAHSLGANISKSALLRKRIIIGDVSLDGAKIYLYTPQDGAMNLLQLLSRFGSDTTKTDKNPTRIALRNLRITDSRFKYQREGADTLSRGVNFGNMIFDNLSLSAPSLDINGGAIGMDIAAMSFTDISGFTVEELSTPKLTVDNGTIQIEDGRIITPRSDLFLPLFSMKGETWKAMGDITDSVRFDLKLERSSVSTRTLAYLVHSLPRSEGVDLTDVNLTFTGKISDFRARASLYASDHETELALDASVAGVTDIRNAVFYIIIDTLATNGESLRRIAGGFLADSLPAGTAGMLDRTGTISLTGSVTGETENFIAEMLLRADAGTVTLTAKGGMPEAGGLDFNGRVKVDGLDAGRLIDNSLLGRITVDAKANGRVGNDNMNINGSIYIPSVQFNGYTYTQITAAGSYINRNIAANLASADPKLLLSLNGTADLTDTVPDINATVNLRKIDLYQLNITPKDSVSVLSGNIRAVGSGSNPDNINGQVVISELRYTSSTDDVRADSILIVGRNSEQSKYLALHSSFADAEFKSGIGYREIFRYLNHILYDYLPALDPTGEALANHRSGAPVSPHGAPRTFVQNPAAIAFADSPKAGESSPLRFSRHKGTPSLSELYIDIKEANNIAAIFLPGFTIAKGTRADIVFNPLTETFDVTANSDYIEYSDFLVTRLGLKADNYTKEDTITIKFTTEDLYLPGFSMPSNEISAWIADDKIAANAQISNSTTDLNASLDIESLLSRSADNSRLRIGVLFDPASYVITGDQRWNISSDLIEYDPERIKINDFLIRNGGQQLRIDGTVSKSKTDTLRLDLDRFDLLPLNSLLGMQNASIGGTLDGGAELISGMKDPVLIADIRMDSLRVNDYVSAPLRLSSTWDFATERAGLLLKNMNTDKNLIRGFYRPDTKSYFATVDIDSVPLAAVNPFLPPEVLRSVEGSTAMYLEVSGSKGVPDMNGTVSVSDFAATIGITNVTYSAKTLDIDIDGSTVRLPKTILTDNEGNHATLEADADISNTSNITYDARLVPTNIMAINTGARDNEQFYGKVYISGAVNVRGSRSGIDVDVAITTQPNSAFYLSLSNKSSVSEADWITFQSREPDESTPENVLEHKKLMYENSLRELSKKTEKTDVNLNVSLNVNPGLLLSIIIDPATNMALNARGSAALDVMINPGTGELSTFGTYEISEGDFLFSLQPVISNKKFILQRGSTIQLSGDPMDALLNIEAVYRLRASLPASLNVSSLESTRIPVDCIVKISENLAHPDLTFDIRIPSADADLQNILSGALSSNEDRALNFLWLVGFGTFAPDGASQTDADPTSAGTALGLDFLTNQIANAFSTNELSIMLRYRPEDKNSSNEVDFGFSYNVGGNDRLILEVEGNYNSGDNGKIRNNTDITGDASITWIITPSGNLSLKAFTRTINRFDENQGLQENGVGIYYKEDFNVFSDIVNQQKQRREARRRKRAERAASRRASTQPLPSGDAPATGSEDLPPLDSGVQEPVKSRIEQRKQESEEQRRQFMEEMRRRQREEADSAGEAVHAEDDAEAEK